jgi:hypothetical protein
VADSRGKPYTVTAGNPWPHAAANIDEMFQMLFKDVETAQATASEALTKAETVTGDETLTLAQVMERVVIDI